MKPILRGSYGIVGAVGGLFLGLLMLESITAIVAMSIAWGIAAMFFGELSEGEVEEAVRRNELLLELDERKRGADRTLNDEEATRDVLPSYEKANEMHSYNNEREAGKTLNDEKTNGIHNQTKKNKKVTFVEPVEKEENEIHKEK